MHLLLRACFFLVLLQQSHAAPAPDPDCGVNYWCYSVQTNELNGLLILKEIIKSAPQKAIVKIHAYNEKHYSIVMQSWENNIDSIEFSKIDSMENIFSCTKQGSGVEFKAGDTVVKESKNSMNPLKCEAEFKTLKPILEKDKIGKFQLRAGVLYKAVTPSDKDTFFFCDPKELKYKPGNFDTTKSYKKVNMHLSNVFCGDKYTGDSEEQVFGIYKHKFEYRTSDSSEYEKLDKLSCVFENSDWNYALTLRGQSESVKLPRGTNIDVRCVADAKYFCDFDPLSSPGKQPLKRTQISNRHSNPPIESKLSCPSTHKYFVIKGKPPVVDAKFECRNVNRQLVWTVNNRSLTKDGPEVYCAAELDCIAIPNSQLHGAILDDQKMPTCHKNGEIEISSKEGRAKVVEITCDRSQGKIKYKTHQGGLSIVWSENNHLYCVYPDHQALHDARVNDVVFRAALCGGISFLVCSVFGALFLLYCYWKQKKEPSYFRKYKQADLEESKRFQRAINKEDEEPSGVEKKSKSSAATKSKADGVSSTAPKEKAPKDTTAKEKRKGIFSEENGVVTTLEAPKTLKEDIKQAYLDNEKNRFRMDGFPDANQLRYRGDVKGVMDENMKKNAETISGQREIVRTAKTGAMAKQALTK